MSSAMRLAPLALALCLLFAGCGSGPGVGSTTAPPASAESTSEGVTSTGPTTTATLDGADSGVVTAEYSVAVENGTLPVNATLTFARVQALLGSDVEPWPVRVRNLSEWRASVGRVGASPLNRAVGFENVSVDWSEPTGLTTVGAVHVHPGDGQPGATERVLAHEFVHLVQYRTSMLPWVEQLNQPRLTTDRRKTRRALIEGGAVYVTDAYTRRYLDGQTNSAYVRDRYRAGTATQRSALAQYYFGAQYVAHRIDDPSNLSAAYEGYPRTTEQVMHNYSRREEPPANLSVTASAPAANWTDRGNDTLGEMALQRALDTELPRERAAAAATGWGTDRLLVYQHASNTSRFGWTWIMRWDTPREANELAAELDEYAVARDDDSPYRFRTTTVDSRTVALVFGDAAFVERATVTATDGGVSARVED